MFLCRYYQMGVHRRMFKQSKKNDSDFQLRGELFRRQLPSMAVNLGHICYILVNIIWKSSQLVDKWRPVDCDNIIMEAVIPERFFLVYLFIWDCWNGGHFDGFPDFHLDHSGSLSQTRAILRMSGNFILSGVVIFVHGVFLSAIFV